MRIITSQNQTKNKGRRECGETGTFVRCWCEQYGKPYLENSTAIPQKRGQNDHASQQPHLGEHAQRTETDRHTPLVVAAWLTLGKGGNNPNVKRSKISRYTKRGIDAQPTIIQDGNSDGTTWMNPEDIMPSEISRTQKGKHVWSHSHEAPGVARVMETERRMAVARGWGEVGMMFNWDTKMRMFWRWAVVRAVPRCERTSCHRTVQLNTVRTAKFTLCTFTSGVNYISPYPTSIFNVYL